MAKKRKRTSMAGAGCFMQGLGLTSLVAAVVTIATVVGPIVFGILGVWLLIAGSSRSQWWECAACGTKLAGRQVTICPGCQSPLD